MTLTVDTLRQAQRRANTDAQIIAQLRKENRYLRRRLTDNSPAGRILRRAYDDAGLLLVWRSAGYYPSLAWAGEQGMSERRWQWARGLLRVARLLEADYLAEDMDFAGRRLRATYERLRQGDDDDLQELRRRMPRKYWLRRKG